MRHPSVWSITGTLLFASLSLTATAQAKLSPTNGVYTAKIGAVCQTQDYGLAAIFLSDLTRVAQMYEAHDRVAAQRMHDDKRVIWVKTGLSVQITERIEGDGVRLTTVQVRPIGHTGELWMLANALECPKPAMASRK